MKRRPAQYHNHYQIQVLRTAILDYEKLILEFQIKKMKAEKTLKNYMIC